MFNGIKNYLFGYDAAEDSPRRRSRAINLRAEDIVASGRERKKLVSDSRNLVRNFAPAAWALRKHLDYISTFEFQCETGDTELDNRIEELVAWWSRPGNFDVTGRWSRQAYTRLKVGCATIDGDAFSMLLDDGLVQAIEGDKVREPDSFNKPLDFNPDDWMQGIRYTQSGRPVEYCVCDRATTGNGYELKQRVPSRFIIPFGCYHRFDQGRGISPLSSALNTFADLLEANEYALARMKISQLFGLVIQDGSEESLDGTDYEDEEQSPPADYSVDFGKGAFSLRLQPGDKAEFLESHQPSNEFAAYMQAMTAAALKSLDIPYSFYDESHTNYSGARQALLQYEQSAANKRRDVKHFLDRITRWRLGLFIDDGFLELPRGMQIRDLRWEYRPTGVPWIDPLKEANAEIALVDAGLSSRQDVCKSHGRDWHEVVNRLSEEKRIMTELGLTSTTDVNALTETTLAITAAENQDGGK